MASDHLSRRQQRLRDEGAEADEEVGTPGKATLVGRQHAPAPRSPHDEARSLIDELADRTDRLDAAIQARDFDAADRASCIVDRFVQALSNALDSACDPELACRAAPILARLDALMPLAPEPRTPSERDRSRRQAEWQARVGSGGGTGLPSALRGKLEHSLGGTSLGDVRIHTDGAAQTSAASLGASAYTVGQDIYFGAGQYDPDSARGQHVIAHEVAHTVQQRGTGDAAREGGGESEADSFAQAFSRGDTAAIGESFAPSVQPILVPVVAGLLLDEAGAFDPIKDAIQRGSAKALSTLVESGAQLLQVLAVAGGQARDLIVLVADISLDIIADAIRLAKDSWIVELILTAIGNEYAMGTMRLLIDFGVKVVSKVLHWMRDSEVFSVLALVLFEAPFEVQKTILRFLGGPVLRKLWQLFRDAVLRYILALLDEHWPIGKGIALTGHVGATFGYPVYLGGSRDVSVSRPDPTNVALYRRGEIVAAFDTGGSMGAYYGTRNIGVGAQAGGNLAVGYKATLVQDFVFPIFEQPETFITLVLSFLMLENVFVRQIGEMLFGNIPDPMQYNTRTQFGLAGFAKATGEAGAGLTEPGEKTKNGVQKGNSAPDIGKRSWLMRVFGVQASILGEAGVEAGLGCEVTQDWSGVTDRSEGPKRATLSVFAETQAAAKLLHNFPLIPQLPEVGGGLGVRVNFAATPESELTYESMQVYVKQGDLDRYQGPAGEAAVEVSRDMLHSALGEQQKLLAQLADQPVSIRRRFAVSTGTGQAWLNRSRNGLRSLLPNTSQKAFTLEGYLTIAVQMTGAQTAALVKRVIQAAKNLNGRALGDLVVDVIKFLGTGHVPKDLGDVVDEIAHMLAPHVTEVKLHGRSGVEARAGAHLAEGLKARGEVHLGGFVTVDKDLKAELGKISGFDLLAILHEEITDGVTKMLVGDDGLPSPARP